MAKQTDKLTGSRADGSLKNPGAWVPWSTVEGLVRLKLAKGSRWRVLLAIVLTSARYGMKDALLSEQGLTSLTRLSRRTVQSSIKELMDLKLVERVGRYKQLRVNWKLVNDGGVVADLPASPANKAKSARRVRLPPIGDKKFGGASKVAPPQLSESHQRSATKLAPPKRKDDCASPTVAIVSLLSEVGSEVFTSKQVTTIRDVLGESTELLGRDVGELTMSEHLASRMQLTSPLTYTAALKVVAASGNPKVARGFTRAVLALRKDERVQGAELKLSSQ